MHIPIIALYDAVIKIQLDLAVFFKDGYPISSTAVMVVKSKCVPDTWKSKSI